MCSGGAGRGSRSTVRAFRRRAYDVSIRCNARAALGIQWLELRSMRSYSTFGWAGIVSISINQPNQAYANVPSTPILPCTPNLTSPPPLTAGPRTTI